MVIGQPQYGKTSKTWLATVIMDKNDTQYYALISKTSNMRILITSGKHSLQKVVVNPEVGVYRCSSEYTF